MTLTETVPETVAGESEATVRYRDVGQGATGGYLRVNVALDADHDGTAEESATTPVYGFSKQSLPVGQTTLNKM